MRVFMIISIVSSCIVICLIILAIIAFAVMYSGRIAHTVRNFSKSQKFLLKDRIPFMSIQKNQYFGLESIVNKIYIEYKKHYKSTYSTLSGNQFLRNSQFVLYYNTLPKCLPSFGFVLKTDAESDLHSHLKLSPKLRKLYSEFLLSHQARDIYGVFFKMRSFPVTSDVFTSNSILKELGLDLDGDTVTCIMIPLETIMCLNKGDDE